MKVKNLLIITWISLISIQSFSQYSGIDLKSKGVIFQLAVYKNAIESRTSQLLNATKTPEDDKAKISANYQTLKTELDGAVLQLKYEMNKKNNLVKKFHKINEAFLDNKYENATYTDDKISTFAKEINQYIKNAKIFLLDPVKLETTAKVHPPRMPAPDTFIDLSSISPLDFIGGGWTIYKDLKDLQGDKADGLASLLTEITLSNVKDLMKE
jgi:hypothetical protein